jgi:hypothetical protein
MWIASDVVHLLACGAWLGIAGLVHMLGSTKPVAWQRG